MSTRAVIMSIDSFRTILVSFSDNIGLRASIPAHLVYGWMSCPGNRLGTRHVLLEMDGGYRLSASNSFLRQTSSIPQSLSKPAWPTNVSGKAWSVGFEFHAWHDEQQSHAVRLTTMFAKHSDDFKIRESLLGKGVLLRHASRENSV